MLPSGVSEACSILSRPSGPAQIERSFRLPRKVGPTAGVHALLACRPTTLSSLPLRIILL